MKITRIVLLMVGIVGAAAQAHAGRVEPICKVNLRSWNQVGDNLTTLIFRSEDEDFCGFEIDFDPQTEEMREVRINVEQTVVDQEGIIQVQNLVSYTNDMMEGFFNRSPSSTQEYKELIEAECNDEFYLVQHTHAYTDHSDDHGGYYTSYDLWVLPAVNGRFDDDVSPIMTFNAYKRDIEPFETYDTNTTIDYLEDE